MSEDFLSKILSQFGGSSQEYVFLSVTPGVGLEMCQLDVTTSPKSVKAYAVRELAYNETSKDIADYEVFKNAVADMYDELKINPKCNVVVNIPLVSMGTMNLPLILSDDALLVSITSEVEQTYIFRRMEPTIAWQDVNVNQSTDSRKILYSAVQAPVIENIKTALATLGSTLIGVDVSVASYLRALDFTGLTTAQMQDNITWNLMIVNSTGYSLVSLVGKTVVDYYEEPLAIKTFEGDDIYNAINASAQITLMSYPANYLYIISETDMVSAELLASKIQGAGTIDFFENNTFKKHEVMPVSLDVLPDNVLKISMQAIGVAATNYSNFPLKFDFIKEAKASKGGGLLAGSSSEPPVPITIGDKTFEITPSAATTIATVLLVAIGVPFALLAFVLLPKVEADKQQALDAVTIKAQELDDQVSKIDQEQSNTGSFDLKGEVDVVLKNNRSKLMSYSAVGESIPNTVWITYFMTQGDGLVDIKGAATNVEDIYVFFKNMKDSLINTKLRLQKLEMQSGSVDDLLSSSGSQNYEFEITNMTTDQLSALFGKLKGEDGKSEDPNAPASADNKDGKGQGNGLLGNTPIPDLGKK
ncbi:TPA: PilN domain-containing protein [Candidatus Scatousia excrementigallinarum]|uniref:PilN domain-containing protein n=1 Tax=Candidatus Scatousia excrementigallinarum TaxID=2840935 RepID=A0A9D1JMD9_9BACT|nr:PilN domain-containing protein [Candidatus Scatousia excrementigallinarum]